MVFRYLRTMCLGVFEDADLGFCKATRQLSARRHLERPRRSTFLYFFSLADARRFERSVYRPRENLSI
jgi:hypothetical protein